MYPNWHQSEVADKFWSQNKYLKIGFSQNGEDDYIRSHFWERLLNGYKGHYIDIGCFHESLYSNTKLLSLFGWNGIAVDASAGMHQLWMESRTEDTFINVAIVSNKEKSQLYKQETKMIKFFRFDDQALNTTNIKLAQERVQNGNLFLDEINVKAVGLDELAEMIKKAQPFINPDFINIDIEQVDYLDEMGQFLEIMNKPELLCLEAVTPELSIENYHDTKEYKVLLSAGYKVDALIGGNIFAFFKN